MNVGRLNGIFPEIGTMVGPDDTGRYFVVTGLDEQGCTLAYAQRSDFDAVREPEHCPRSLAEIALRQVAW